MQIKISSKYNLYILSLFIAYLLSHGGILFLPTAIYWDDWTLYMVDPETISETFLQAGTLFNWVGIIHNFLLLLGPYAYKYLTFILMFGSGVLFDLILKLDFKIRLDERFILVLLFLLLPFNIARVTLITFPYTLCYFIFFLAWYLIRKNPILSIILFFLSFNTNSLLVFYFIPLIGIYYKNYSTFKIDFFIKFIKENTVFLILPLLYYFIKIKFFRPYGIYENYNSLNNIDYIMNIYNALARCLEDTLITLFEINNLLIYTIIFSFVIYTLITHIKFLKFNMGNWKSSNFIFVGFFAILLALLPYVILGLAPTFQEWSSRHQLLLPLGTSFLLVGILSFFGSQLRLFLLIFIVNTSITINVANYVALYQDWNKQKALIMLFKDNEEIKNAGIVGFIDETKSLNAINRTYRIYEWNGLMKAAFGDEKRFGVEGEGFQWARERGGNKDFVNASNNNKDFKNDNTRPPLIVRILPANTRENIYKDIFNKNAVKIEVERPLP